MKVLLIVIVVLLVGIAGLGFYQGWFRLSTDGTEQESSATVTVDKDKIHADRESAKEKMQELGTRVKETTGEVTDQVKP